MKTPGILKGIIFATIASLGSGLLASILPLAFTQITSYSLIVITLSLSYLVFLLKHSDSRRGMVVVFTFWFTISLGGWFLGISLIEQILVQLLIIWAVRSLYFHSSILSALLDLLLITMAAGAGVWAVLQTDSPVVAIWTFFLCQSLFGAIPTLSNRHNPGLHTSDQTTDRFQAAHRVALDAVRKLSLN